MAGPAGVGATALISLPEEHTIPGKKGGKNRIKNKLKEKEKHTK